MSDILDKDLLPQDIYWGSSLWWPVLWNNKTGYERTIGVQGFVDSGNKTASWDFPVYVAMLSNDRISHKFFIELNTSVAQNWNKECICWNYDGEFYLGA